MSETKIEMPPVHEAANLFEMMTPDELRKLADDIKANGQDQPCSLYQGKLLDGRNRWAACELAGVAPRSEVITEIPSFDPLSYVVTKNLHRRHLDTNQRAKIGEMLEARFERHAKGTAPDNGEPVAKLPPNDNSKKKSRDKAAAIAKVSPRTIQDRKAVTKKGSPELQASVDAGEVSVADGAKIARTIPKDKQLEAVKANSLAPAADPSNDVQRRLAKAWDKANQKDKTWFRSYIKGK